MLFVLLSNPCRPFLLLVLLFLTSHLPLCLGFLLSSLAVLCSILHKSVTRNSQIIPSDPLHLYILYLIIHSPYSLFPLFHRYFSSSIAVFGAISLLSGDGLRKRKSSRERSGSISAINPSVSVRIKRILKRHNSIWKHRAMSLFALLYSLRCVICVGIDQSLCFFSSLSPV